MNMLLNNISFFPFVVGAIFVLFVLEKIQGEKDFLKSSDDNSEEKKN